MPGLQIFNSIKYIYIYILYIAVILNIYIYILYILQFERSGMVLMSHIREASKVTVNSSYFHPAHQHYTDEAHEAETVPSVVIYIYIETQRVLNIIKIEQM
jgi:hypothetical protein